jgi:hypothetical protein
VTAFTSPRTWSGTTLGSSDLNTDIRDNMKNVDERLTVSGITSPSALNKIKSAVCGVRCAQSAAYNAADVTDKTLTWDSEDYDTDGFHSTGSNTHRITIPSGLDGVYLFTAQVDWDANSSGYRRCWIEDDGAIVKAEDIRIAASGSERTESILMAVIAVTAGDWYAVHAYQNSAGTRSMDLNASRCHFGAWRLFAA